VAELKSKGVKFSGIIDDGPVKLAHFKDADGLPSIPLAEQVGLVRS